MNFDMHMGNLPKNDKFLFLKNCRYTRANNFKARIFSNFDPSLTKLFMWVSFMNTTTWLNFGAYVTKIWKKLCLKFVGLHSIFFLCVISHYKNMPDYGFSISSASSFRKSKSTFKPPVGIALMEKLFKKFKQHSSSIRAHIYVIFFPLLK